MGVSVARGLIGGIGVVLLVCGLLVVAAAGPGGTLFALLFLIVPGALMVVAALIERLRYRSLASEGIGESPRSRAAASSTSRVPRSARRTSASSTRRRGSRCASTSIREPATGGTSRSARRGAARHRNPPRTGGVRGGSRTAAWYPRRPDRDRVAGVVAPAPRTGPIVERTMTAVRPAPGPRAASRGRRRATRDQRVPILNRELSWLEYDARVLHEAGDGRNPLLDRVRSLYFFVNNLDEFFQVRVSGLRRQELSGSQALSADGRTAEEQLDAIRARVLELMTEQTTIFGDLRRGLAAEGIEILDYDDVPEHHGTLAQRFHDEIYPVLTPLAVDPGHPFPYISTLTLSIAVGLRDPQTGEHRFARVKIPPLLPRLVEVEPGRFVLLDQVIEANLDELFRGMEILETHLFRVTRDADIAIEEDEADDLLLAIEEEVRRRRFGEAVRLEVERSMPDVHAADPQQGHRRPRRRRLRGRGDARPHRPVAAGGPRSARPQDAALCPRRPGPADAARRGRARGRLRADPWRRPPRAPSVRVVHGLGRAVHRAGGGRPRGPDDQADAVPHLGRLPHRAEPDPRGRARQAGRGAGRDQGALRRGGEHRLGPPSRAGRRPRRLRPRRPQDALQGRAGRPSRGHAACAATSTSPPATTTRRRRARTSTSGCCPSARSSAPTSPTCSTRSPGSRASACSGA